jgi:hypothetical protein
MPTPSAVNNAMTMCSFGAAPSTLGVLPTARTMIEKQPAATIMDAKPMINIRPFGMCMSLSNPTVAAATAAALGVLTPMPCIPVTEAWIPGAPTVLIGGNPGLKMGDQCLCAWGGVIQMTFPGSIQTMTT